MQTSHGVSSRRPAHDTYDGVFDQDFVHFGRGSVGVPVVPVFKGDRHRIEVGPFAWIASGVELLGGGNHRIDWVTTYGLREMFGLPDAFVGQPWSRGDIVIGPAVVIERGSRVLSGVRIGVGARVLPYSVVTRDIEAGAVVQGNPAHGVGRLFPLSIVSELESLGWESDPPESLLAQVSRLLSVPASELSPALSRHRLSTGLRRRVGRGISTVAQGASKAEKALEKVSRRAAPHARVEDMPGLVEMGTASYPGPKVIAEPPTETRGARVRIGNYSSVADDCEVIPWGWRDPAEPDASEPEVVVGSDAWIARGSRLVGPVSVGDGAVVAAYSVVTSDVRPYAIVVGNPAVEIRRRFDDQTVEALLRIQWWHWPQAEVLEHWSEICSENVAEFAARFDPGVSS